MDFAKATFGPPAPGTTDTNKGALIADIQTPAVEMVDAQGNTHGVESTLLLLQAQTALAVITVNIAINNAVALATSTFAWSQNTSNATGTNFCVDTCTALLTRVK